jgi:PAS domain S-box-containing protein
VSPTIDKAHKFAGSAQKATSSAASSLLTSESTDPELDVVFTTDLEGTITGCNMGFRRYGYAPDELVGKRLADLFCADDHAVLTNILIPGVREKGKFERELRGADKTGGEFSVHLCLTLVRDADSIPNGIVAISIGFPENKPQSRGRSPKRAVAALPLARRVIEGTEFLIASPVMHKFMGMVDRVAGHTETVLVVGETGTGKELVARVLLSAQEGVGGYQLRRSSRASGRERIVRL